MARFPANMHQIPELAREHVAASLPLYPWAWYIKRNSEMELV
jgi:hypothetical protein